LLDWADQVGWQLYPDERTMLEHAADVEIYLEAPLDELDVVAFGAAVQKLGERVQSQRQRAERAQLSMPPSVRDAPDDAPGRDKRKEKEKRHRRDDQRGRRWR
jgi:hypothetical protein